MDFERDVKRRIANHPATPQGLLAGIVATVFLVVVLRIAYGIVLEDRAFAITYLAILGGGLGAIAMYRFNTYTTEQRFAPIEFWASVLGDGDLQKYRTQGLYLHVTYGAVAGSFFPRLVNELAPGTAGNLFAALPMSIVTALLFSFGLFVLGFVYAQIGFFRLPIRRRAMGEFFASHAIYGIVLGLSCGLMKTVIQPVFGTAVPL